MNGVLDKNSAVASARLRNRRLVLPFSITGHATPASVITTPSDPQILFIKTEGTNTITAAAETSETVTVSNTTVQDSGGKIGMYVKLTGDNVLQVNSAYVQARSATAASNSITACIMEGTLGITDKGNILLSVDLPSAMDFSAAATYTLTLVVDYQIDPR